MVLHRVTPKPQTLILNPLTQRHPPSYLPIYLPPYLSPDLPTYFPTYRGTSLIRNYRGTLLFINCKSKQQVDDLLVKVDDVFVHGRPLSELGQFVLGTPKQHP